MFEYEIETYCPATGLQARIILQSNREHKGELVSGKPVYCHLQDKCDKTQHPMCYLHSLRLECKGKKRVQLIL